MSFHDKLMALLNFSVTQVLPATVKNPDTQAKILPYIGLGVGMIALIAALTAKTPPSVAPPALPSA